MSRAWGEPTVVDREEEELRLLEAELAVDDATLPAPVWGCSHLAGAAVSGASASLTRPALFSSPSATDSTFGSATTTADGLGRSEAAGSWHSFVGEGAGLASWTRAADSPTASTDAAMPLAPHPATSPAGTYDSATGSGAGSGLGSAAIPSCIDDVDPSTEEASAMRASGAEWKQTLRKGLDNIKLAKTADNNSNHAKAYTLYVRAIADVMKAIRGCPNAGVKRRLRKKVREFLARAEELRDITEGTHSVLGHSGVSSGSLGARASFVASTVPTLPSPRHDAGTGVRGLFGRTTGATMSTEAVVRAATTRSSRHVGAVDGKAAEEEASEAPAPVPAPIRYLKEGATGVSWEDVVGIREAKDALSECVVLPSRFPQLFQGRRRPPNMLLFGPPGCGKTMLVNAVAAETRCPFYSVHACVLLSSWRDGETLVKRMFEAARDEVREGGTALVFIDGIDDLRTRDNPRSRRLRTELLVQMTSPHAEISGNVVVVAATNRPWDVDLSFRRRLPRRVYVGPPDATARASMLETGLSHDRLPSELVPADFAKLASAMTECSGADVVAAVQVICMEPIRYVSGATLWRKDNDGMYRPAADEPPCTHCGRGMPGEATRLSASATAPACGVCQVQRTDLSEIPPSQLGLPELTFVDCLAVVRRTAGSIMDEDLRRHAQWKADFVDE